MAAAGLGEPWRGAVSRTGEKLPRPAVLDAFDLGDGSLSFEKPTRHIKVGGAENDIDHLLDDELRGRTYEWETLRPSTAPVAPQRPNHEGIFTPRAQMHMNAAAMSRLGISKRHSPPRSRPTSPIRSSNMRRSTSPGETGILGHHAASRPSTSPHEATRPSTTESLSHSPPVMARRPPGMSPRQRPAHVDPPLRFHIPARPHTGNKGYTSGVLYPMASQSPQSADMRTACVITQLKRRDRARRKQFKELMTTLPRSSLEQSLEDQLQRMTVMRAETGVHVDTGPLSSRSQHYVPEDSEERLGRLPLSQRPLTLWEKGAKINLPVKQVHRVDAILASHKQEDLRLGRCRVHSNFDPVHRPATSPAALQHKLAHPAGQALTENWEDWLIAPRIWLESRQHTEQMSRAPSEAAHPRTRSHRSNPDYLPRDVSARYLPASLPAEEDQVSALPSKLSSVAESSGRYMALPQHPRSEATFQSLPEHGGNLSRSQSVKHHASHAGPEDARGRARRCQSMASRGAAPRAGAQSSPRQAHSAPSNKRGMRGYTQWQPSRQRSSSRKGLHHVTSSLSMVPHGSASHVSESGPASSNSSSSCRSGSSRPVAQGNMYSSAIYREFLWRKGYRQPTPYQPSAHTWADPESDEESEDGSDFEFSEDRAARRAARKAAAAKPWLAMEAAETAAAASVQGDDAAAPDPLMAVAEGAQAIAEPGATEGMAEE